MAMNSSTEQSMMSICSRIDMEIKPPEYTKKVENCVFRISGDQCCNALNPLRPHACNNYCVDALYMWLKVAYPEFDEETRRSVILELTRVDTDS